MELYGVEDHRGDLRKLAAPFLSLELELAPLPRVALGGELAGGRELHVVDHEGAVGGDVEIFVTLHQERRVEALFDLLDVPASSTRKRYSNFLPAAMVACEDVDPSIFTGRRSPCQ